jgi:hypothetical protein
VAVDGSAGAGNPGVARLQMNVGPSCQDCRAIGKARPAVKVFRADQFTVHKGGKDEGPYSLLVPLCVEHHTERVAAAEAAAKARARANRAVRRRRKAVGR